ncbi:hypothetical protein [Novosphingobium decolorationis]|uniref:Transposase n=1 Tax=Novosphingobium decolorationis TaxID=2698673 RepID=A0ABX8E2D3_9SPHN|nr:hypothetical protein [Novosphingobium decolorationis]QVM82385.1 hypothetical protein HT578_00545 [Novosphingobium decolorationis]
MFGAAKSSDEPTVDERTLHAKIGGLTLANDLLGKVRPEGNWRQGRSVAERKAMIDRLHTLPVKRQAKEMGISRGSAYCLPRLVSPEDLAFMRHMDVSHRVLPFAGSRMLRDLQRQEGIKMGRWHVAIKQKNPTFSPCRSSRPPLDGRGSLEWRLAALLL